MTLTAAQHAIRRTGIGASEIGAIVGAVGAYDRPLAVWARKVGLVEPDDETEIPEHIELGNLLEPVIASLYSRRTGRALYESGTLIHPKDPLRIATPDRIVVGESVGVQIKKARTLGTWGNEGTDDVPENIVAQVQWEMSVADLEVVDVPVLFWGSRLSLYTVKRDDALIDGLAELAHKWWRDHVVANRAPDADGSERTRETLGKMFPENTGKFATPSNDVLVATILHANYYEMAKGDEKAAKERKDAAGNALRLLIGDFDGIALPEGGKVTWTACENGKPSWKEIAQELGATPALIAKHTNPATRTLRVALGKKRS